MPRVVTVGDYGVRRGRLPSIFGMAGSAAHDLRIANAALSLVLLRVATNGGSRSAT
jgi:hypothetical protein